jgi:GNAT superfamily N-acetyltransferase
MPDTQLPLHTIVPRDEFPARFGKTWEEVVSLADRHTLAVQHWLPTRAPEARSFKGQGVIAGSSGLPIPLLNQAVGSNYTPGTSDRIIDDDIEAVKAFFAEREVPWYWWLGPTAQPSNMGQRLERHGLVFDPPALPALVARLPAQHPPINSNAHVWLAVDGGDLEAASTIRRTAFRFPEGAALDYFEAMANDWLRSDPVRLYLARLGAGPPAAIGALIMAEGYPGIYVMATLPEWGRRGLGKAILARMLTEAACEGHSLIVLTASRYGYPLYRQFGFEHIFDYHIYRPVEEM